MPIAKPYTHTTPRSLVAIERVVIRCGVQHAKKARLGDQAGLIRLT